MFKKWLKDYNDLLKMKYRRPQRWYDCRNKNPLIIGEQQIPCRSLKCTSFHCNHARTEVDAKIRLAKFFFIKPNICAVIKFKKPPFYLGDFEISLLKSFINEKLNYQRKKYKFHIEYKMELDLKFKAHFHLTIRDDSNKELVISVKIIKKILEKATLGAFSKLCKFLKKPNIIPKIIIYCAEIKNLKKYANYISKRGKHLKKLVVFPEYWDTKKSRISSSTQAFKILKSKEWLDYYFKNRDLIKCWNGNSDCKNITETQSFNDDKKSLQLDKL